MMASASSSAIQSGSCRNFLSAALRSTPSARVRPLMVSDSRSEAVTGAPLPLFSTNWHWAASPLLLGSHGGLVRATLRPRNENPIPIRLVLRQVATSRSPAVTCGGMALPRASPQVYWRQDDHRREIGRASGRERG